jgi:hypothetical protein
MEQDESKTICETIKESQKLCLQLADEKIVIMEQSERELENYIAKLNKHIEKFQSEHKGTEEQKATTDDKALEQMSGLNQRTSTLSFCLIAARVQDRDCVDSDSP